MNAHLLGILIAVLAQVETPNGVPAHPGKAGETGKWQLTPAVRVERRADLIRAGVEINDKNLAKAQILHIKRELERAHKPAEVFDIAVAWNAGITAKINGTAPASSIDFGKRVEALVNEMK